MLAMHISFSELEAWQAWIASLMSYTGSGSTQVGGGSSFFVGLKLVFLLGEIRPVHTLWANDVI